MDLSVLPRLKSEGVDSILVALSGGKESQLVLVLCIEAGFYTEAFFEYIVPDLPCDQERAEEAAHRYGVKLHTIPHWDRGRCIRNGIYRWNPDSRVPEYDLADIEDTLREKTGILWCANGTRVADINIGHHAMRMRKEAGRNDHLRRVWPLWDWKVAEVVAALSARSIPLPEPAGPMRRNGSSGFCVSGIHMRWLWQRCHEQKRHQPSCFDRVCHSYPLAAAAYARILQYGDEIESFGTRTR